MSHDTSDLATSASDDETVLSVTNLTKIYDDGTLAVDDISFTVDRGEFCVLIGPSGCGKSTTLHSIIGKVRPTEGTIVLNETDITDIPTYKRNIALVFQDFQLFPHLTVEENVRYGLEQLGYEEADIEAELGEIFDLLRLTEIRDRSPEEISAGQKQRVALARSLVLEPDLLLLDEPLGDLDYKLQKFMEREFLRLHRELDTTFVYVTHDQNQAMRLGDKIVVMNDGRIEQAASVDDVYNSPATAFVATFVGDTNVFYATLTDVVADGAEAVMESAFGRFTVSTANLRTEPADLIGEDLVFAVRPQHLRIDGVGENTLECRVQDVIYRPGRGTQIVLEATDDAGDTREFQLQEYEKVSLDRDTVTVGWDPEDAILLEQVSVVEGVDLAKDILGE